jgi:hypothetical protein
LRIASPIVAVFDSLEQAQFAPPLLELAEALDAGLVSRRFSVQTLVSDALRLGQPSLARRLGALVEAVTGSRDERLLKIAHAGHHYTPLGPGPGNVLDAAWRVRSPQSVAQIAALLAA